MNHESLIRVAGSQALAELERLRREASQTGLHPILFGDQEEYERAVENRQWSIEEGKTAESILQEAASIDVSDWIETKIGEYVDVEDREEDEWPDDPTEELGIITHTDLLNGEPKPEVLIGLFRLDRSWQVFAELMWGEFNDCPSPAEHCAIHRYWEEQYGAQVVSITADVVQCFVTRPPKTREDSVRLAREQYAYCCDIVEQGTGTITNLAAGLIDSPYWYFWWD